MIRPLGTNPRGRFLSQIRNAARSRVPIRVPGFFVAQKQEHHYEFRRFLPAGASPPPIRKQENKHRDLEVNMKIIRIKDYYGNYQVVPVDDQFFEEWCKLRNEDHNQKRRANAHCISFEEAVLESLHNNPSEDPIFDKYARMEENLKLYEAIRKLSPIQRKRIYMLLDNMSYTDIARAEERDLSVVHRSIGKALLHLRHFLSE